MRAAEELLAAGGDPWHGAPKKERQHKRGEVRCLHTHPQLAHTLVLAVLAVFAAGTSACTPKRAHEEGQGSKGEQRDPKKQLTSVPLPTSAGNVANAHIAALFEQLG